MVTSENNIIKIFWKFYFMLLFTSGVLWLACHTQEWEEEWDTLPQRELCELLLQPRLQTVRFNPAHVSGWWDLDRRTRTLHYRLVLIWNKAKLICDVFVSVRNTIMRGLSEIQSTPTRRAGQFHSFQIYFNECFSLNLTRERNVNQAKACMEEVHFY